MGEFKATVGAIVRPLGHPTAMVATKPGEVQPIGNLVIFDTTNRYFKNPGASATSGNYGVVANTNLNGKYDGHREVIFGHGNEVWCNVRAGGNIVPGNEVIFSATPGRVDTAALDGSDGGTLKIVGKMKFKALEFWKDGIVNAFTNAVAGDIITIHLYGTTR